MRDIRFSMRTMTTPTNQNDYMDEMTPDAAPSPAASKEQTMIAEFGLAAALAFGPAAAAAADLPAAQMEFRECVAQRESHGNYLAVNRTEPSSAQGRYQFLDRKWRFGLAHMVADALRDAGMPWNKAVKVRTSLRKAEIRKWDPILQDVAFAATLNARGPWSGWTHWHINGSRCNSLVPAGAR